MLGLQGTTLSSKVYRCGACSAVFNGLASLLVHQATHASADTQASADPLPVGANWRPKDAPGENANSSTRQSGPTTGTSESTSSSFYICDCGEEFQDFGLMLDHKNTHALHAASEPAPAKDTSPTPSLVQPVNKSTPDFSCPSTSKSPIAESPIIPAQETEGHKEDCVEVLKNPQGQASSVSSHVDSENPLKMSTVAEPENELGGDMSVQEGQSSSQTAEATSFLPSNNVLMKMLASAYTNRYSASESQSSVRDIKPPKQETETVPLDVTPEPTPLLASNDHSVAQVRRLLAKPGAVTKAPSISRIIDLSRKKVVSLTKGFSPVVVLETRQTLVDYSRGFLGKYQCGRCRRVFQDIDRLTEHHFLHKKERIKCCRRCKQLIIGRLPLPDNHVCPQLGSKSMQPSILLKDKPQFNQKLVPFHSLNNAKKVFYCPLCKHSYARRWNLKTHKCQGRTTALIRHSNPPFQKIFALRSNATKNTRADGMNADCQIKTVGVSTDITNQIKVEFSPPQTKEPQLSQLAWTQGKKFSSFPSKVFQNNVESLQKGEENRFQADELEEEEEEEEEEDVDRQWTSPLDDELEEFSSAGKNTVEGKRNTPLMADPPNMAFHSQRYFVRDGVKRYPCNRCQKTYSQVATLRRHLRLCGVRPFGVGNENPNISQSANELNANRVRPMFPCFVCGRIFNRKDNMMTHRKRCQLQRTMSDGERASVPTPRSNTTDAKAHEEDGGNWGIMSLPTVLPRRVTCECGAGFTSPRLLLEHLQKHAQESYTCPTCGETVGSWADYEIHLQIHMHPHHQLLKGPQRSQPLLLRIQQQQQQEQTVLLPNPIKKQQRIACTKCGNTFSSHHSLRRHISWNRCKGVRVTNQAPHTPKVHRCSQCNSDFPNSISLIFHQRSGACKPLSKPPIKPVRCPVCLRWFGTVQSLQKHLLTHKQSTVLHCDICQGTYANLKSLQNHRRKIHGIMLGGPKLTTNEHLNT